MIVQLQGASLSEGRLLPSKVAQCGEALLTKRMGGFHFGAHTVEGKHGPLKLSYDTHIVP